MFFNMVECGSVVEADEKYAIVRINRTAACEKCKMCGFKEGSRYIDVRVENTLAAKQGDLVEIEMGNKTILFASFIVYIVPLAFAAFGLFIGNLIGNTVWQLILCLGMLMLGYIMVSLVDKKIRHNRKFQPVMTCVYAVPLSEEPRED